MILHDMITLPPSDAQSMSAGSGDSFRILPVHWWFPTPDSCCTVCMSFFIACQPSKRMKSGPIFESRKALGISGFARCQVKIFTHPPLQEGVGCTTAIQLLYFGSKCSSEWERGRAVSVHEVPACMHEVPGLIPTCAGCSFSSGGCICSCDGRVLGLGFLVCCHAVDFLGDG